MENKLFFLIKTGKKLMITLFLLPNAKNYSFKKENCLEIAKEKLVQIDM